VSDTGRDLHIANGEHGLVTSSDWVAGQLASANRHFAALDIGFELAQGDADQDPHDHLQADERRQDHAQGHCGGRHADPRQLLVRQFGYVDATSYSSMY